MPIIAIYALVASLIFGSGFGLGYQTKSKLDQIKYTKELKIELEKQGKHIQIVHDIEKVYIEGEVKTNTIYKTITKEVVKYVPKIQTIDSDCNLTNGTVRLLNSNASNKMPIASGEPITTDTAASSVTELRHINYTNEIINQYNKAMNQCNSLIDYSKKVAVE